MVMTLLTRPKKTVATVIVATDGSGDFNTDGTDDEVEINAALNSLPAGGGVVYMKEGTYNITTSIIIPDDNVEIIGAGASTRITTTQDIAMITMTNVERISIHLIYLYGAGVGGVTNYGIYFDNVDTSSIDGCWIENVGFAAIYLTNASNQNTIHNCKIINNSRLGIYMYASSYNNILNNQCSNNNLNAAIFLEHDCFFNVIISNQCNDNGVSGIILGDNSDHNIIEGNVILSNDWRGIMILETADNNTITNNQILRNIADGIYIRSHDNMISSNECFDNDFGNTGTYNGIILVEADRNVITNNRCSGNDDWGINIFDMFCNDNLVIGNTCIGNTTGAIQDNGTNTLPNGARGTTNLQLDDLNILA